MCYEGLSGAIARLSLQVYSIEDGTPFVGKMMNDGHIDFNAVESEAEIDDDENNVGETTT